MNLLSPFTSRRPVAELVSGPLLEYQSPTASLIAQPPSALARNVPMAIFLFLFTLVVLSMTVPINIIVTGFGNVATDTNIDVIQPLETSIIKQIYVKPGQHVNKGDLLAELDPTFTQSDLGSLQAQYDSAQANVERLRAEIDNKAYVPSRQTVYTANALREYQQDKAQLNSTLDSYTTKVKSLQAALASAQSQLASYQQQSAIADEVLSKRQELFNLHVGSQLDLLSE